MKQYYSSGDGLFVASTVRLSKYKYRVYTIDLLSTLPQYRKQGYARKVMEEVIADADAFEVALRVVCVEALNPFYTSLGFEKSSSSFDVWRRISK